MSKANFTSPRRPSVTDSPSSLRTHKTVTPSKPRQRRGSVENGAKGHALKKPSVTGGAAKKFYFSFKIGEETHRLTIPLNDLDELKDEVESVFNQLEEISNLMAAVIDNLEGNFKSENFLEELRRLADRFLATSNNIISLRRSLVAVSDREASPTDSIPVAVVSRTLVWTNIRFCFQTILLRLYLHFKPAFHGRDPWKSRDPERLSAQFVHQLERKVDMSKKIYQSASKNAVIVFSGLMMMGVDIIAPLTRAQKMINSLQGRLLEKGMVDFQPEILQMAVQSCQNMATKTGFDKWSVLQNSMLQDHILECRILSQMIVNPSILKCVETLEEALSRSRAPSFFSPLEGEDDPLLKLRMNTMKGRIINEKPWTFSELVERICRPKDRREPFYNPYRYKVLNQWVRKVKRRTAQNSPAQNSPVSSERDSKNESENPTIKVGYVNSNVT